MAPSVGRLHQLVARNIKLFKQAWKQAQQQIPILRGSQPALQPIPIRTHPLHPLAALRQSKGRWFTTQSAVRRFATSVQKNSAGEFKYDRASFPKSRTATAIAGFTGRTPFASTLRPNLTGGTLGRTAGGYSLGSGRIGGARYFSHTPAAPAQVVHNVSQAVRAFWLSGNKAQFAGTNPRSGEKRYTAISTLQDDTVRKAQSVPKATPGSYVEFAVSPTITAITPLSAVAGYTKTATHDSQPEASLNADGLLDILSVDFSRALKDLAAVLTDLKRLSNLGDLPITYASDNSLRVHFPGCDCETVERLCTEIGISRGVVVQDADFDAFAGTEIALLFPFAPSNPQSVATNDYEEAPCLYEYRDTKQPVLDWADMQSEEYSTRSETSISFEHLSQPADKQVSYDLSSSPRSHFENARSSSGLYSELDSPADPLEYQSFEGIYRFIELCDDSRR